MSVLHTIWSYVTAWFGYVSWCMSATDMACKPFLAFVALLAASAGILTLVCHALSLLLNDLACELEQRRRKRHMAEQAALVRAKLAHAPAPAAAPLLSAGEPVVPGTAALTAREAGWGEMSIASAALHPPSPSAPVTAIRREGLT